MTRDDAALRALQRIPYGLYVIGSLHEGVPVTMIGNWVTQVSFHPLCIALALEQDSRMRMFVHASGVFSLNILHQGERRSPRSISKDLLRKEERSGDEGSPPRPMEPLFCAMLPLRLPASYCMRWKPEITWLFSARLSMRSSPPMTRES